MASAAKIYHFLVVCLLCVESLMCIGNYPPSRRRKRYLSFPNKAALVLTISLLKGIANDIVVGPTVKVVTIHELDVIFPLPHDPSPFQLSQTALGQPPVFRQPSSAHSRHRRDLYRQLEELFYMQGHEGRACLLKALCDMKALPKTTEENLLQDLLSVIFSLPVNGTSGMPEEYITDKRDCSKYTKLCPFSIFDLAFDWADQFARLYSA